MATPNKTPMKSHPSEDLNSIQIVPPGEQEISGMVNGDRLSATITPSANYAMLATAWLCAIQASLRTMCKTEFAVPIKIGGRKQYGSPNTFSFVDGDPSVSGLFLHFLVIDGAPKEIESSPAYTITDPINLLLMFAASRQEKAQTVTASARAASDTTEMDDGDGLPDNIQMFPPGKMTVTPQVDGVPKTITINVTPELADLFESQRQQMSQDADNGNGVTPFVDFDHKNEASAGEVTRIFWGGNDPKTGGIRGSIKWSAAGKAAVVGRNYRRFSPQWKLDKTTHQPVGISHNVGSLVNDPAFRNIASLTAKASAASRAAATGPRTQDMASQVKDLAAKRNISLDEAFKVFLQQNPTWFSDWYKKMIPPGSVNPAPNTDTAESFVAAAQALADRKNISLADAVTALARNNNAYSDYLAEMGNPLQFKQDKKTRVSEDAQDRAQDVIATAKEHAKKFGITESEAVAKLMQSNPDFYKDYMKAMGLRK